MFVFYFFGAGLWLCFCQVMFLFNFWLLFLSLVNCGFSLSVAFLQKHPSFTSSLKAAVWTNKTSYCKWFFCPLRHGLYSTSFEHKQNWKMPNLLALTTPLIASSKSWIQTRVWKTQSMFAVNPIIMTSSLEVFLSACVSISISSRNQWQTLWENWPMTI